MKYAQIKDGIVQNIIVLNDTSLESIFIRGFDSLIRIDNLDVIPQMGDLYDPQTNTFTRIQSDS